jgi:NAD(P)-dependent dehydrogenase (short-subunit alcohol dehydrogenase family)
VIKVPRRHLVQATTAKLRELILSREPGAQIGSLNEVAQLLDVGIVTVQQAARILEHEGLLTVRRGPGGGYYGTRPDEAALERSIAAYLRVHGFGHRESQQMLSLLDCEIVPAAARCTDTSLRETVRELLNRVDLCDSSEERITFDILMNNVGVILSGNPEDIPSSEWRRIMDLNFFAAIHGMQVMSPKMIERGSGHIVNTASFAGLYPYAANRIPYVAAKAAVVAMSESLAVYLHPKGVRVSCFCPGPVATAVMSNMKTWSANVAFRGPGSQYDVITA